MEQFLPSATRPRFILIHNRRHAMRTDINPAKWPTMEGYELVDVVEHGGWLGEENVKLMVLPGEKAAISRGGHVLFFREAKNVKKDNEMRLDSID